MVTAKIVRLANIKTRLVRIAANLVMAAKWVLLNPRAHYARLGSIFIMMIFTLTHHAGIVAAEIARLAIFKSPLVRLLVNNAPKVM